MGHPQAEPTANPSHLEQILSRLVPQGLSAMASGKDSSATSSNSCMNQAPLPAAPAVAAEVHQSDDNLELQQLKQELLVAKAQLAMQEEELAQNRVIKHTFEQALGSPSEADFGGCEVTDQALTHLQGTPNATTHHGFDQIQNAWNANEGSQSDVALPLSPGAISRATLLWNQTGQLAYPSTQPTCNPASNETTLEKGSGEPQYVSGSTTQPPMQPWNGMTAFPFLVPAQRAPSSSNSAYGFCPRPSDEPPRYSQAAVQVQNPVPRRSFGPQITAGALFPSPANPWSSGSPVSTLESTPKSPIAPSTSSSSSTLTAGYPWGYPGFAPRQSGTRLSPTATEFTTSSQESSAWTGPAVSSSPHIEEVILYKESY